MQEIRFKIECHTNGSEKFITFSLNNKLVFIDSFQFISTSWDILVKNLGENDFKYLSQKFDSEVLDLVKQKLFYSYKYKASFEKFKEKLPVINEFYSSLSDKGISDK